MVDEPITSRLYKLFFKTEKPNQPERPFIASQEASPQKGFEAPQPSMSKDEQEVLPHSEAFEAQQGEFRSTQDPVQQKIEELQQLQANHLERMRSHAVDMERLLYYDELVHQLVNEGDWWSLSSSVGVDQSGDTTLKAVLDHLHKLKDGLSEREHEVAAGQAALALQEATHKIRDGRLIKANEREISLKKKIDDLERSNALGIMQLTEANENAKKNQTELLDKIKELKKTLSKYPGSPEKTMQIFVNKDLMVNQQEGLIAELRSKVREITERRDELIKQVMAKHLVPSPKPEIRAPYDLDSLSRSKRLEAETAARMLRLKDEQKRAQDSWGVEKKNLEAKITELVKSSAVRENNITKIAADAVSSDLDLTLISEIPEIGFPEDLQFPTTVCTMGSGPWSEDDFDNLLTSNGFNLCNLPHTGVQVVILGRKGWTQSAILNQIDDREGDSLRVYSQELFLMGLLRGADPLEGWPNDLLELWGKSHPALRFLMNRETAWPQVIDPDEPFDPEKDLDYQLVDRSPLSEMGYHVGLSSSLSPAERRALLRKALEGPLPVVADTAYMETWGRPKSSRRLGRMAWHIAWLANTQGKARNKEVARKEWIEDLAWMKRQLFPQYGKGFKWPST